ncbi:glycosyltransferase [Desulfohalobiaceae bacterium Ax17]|uniref:glycosyltransferase n=1 Tax=Desulfovulcanus ferrireducens TaxID=2831190 RepID=UPI00207BACEF|nr:glycosyltransferase [Desulfovulcanus ferrireducens]MBT8763332.1 glycosyltransferase [Desulfovulcanus ferrireducens]
MKIVFLTQGDRNHPSSRFRVFQYLDLFNRDGIDIFAVRYPKKFFQKLKICIRNFNADILFIQKKIPSMFDIILFKSFFKTIVFDFDDAIWTKTNLNLGEKIKQKKIAKIKRLADNIDLVLCGNSYLYSFLKKYTKTKIKILPTPYEPPTLNRDKKEFTLSKINILWIGTKYNLNYLKIWENSLAKLQCKFNFNIIICSNLDNINNDYFKFKFLYHKWSIITEEKLLKECHIGLMPLPNNEYTKGKCGFKLIQYMANGLIGIASNVGFNNELISDGYDGFLCKDNDDLKSIITNIFSGRIDLTNISLNAIKKIKKIFSL